MQFHTSAQDEKAHGSHVLLKHITLSSCLGRSLSHYRTWAIHVSAIIESRARVKECDRGALARVKVTIRFVVRIYFRGL
jgi:hypothetical protein